MASRKNDAPLKVLKQNQHKVAVVIPVINQAEKIEGMIKNLKGMTRNGLPLIAEIVVSDGGSIDGTQAVVRQSGAVLIEESPHQWRLFLKTFMHLQLNSCVFETSSWEEGSVSNSLSHVIFINVHHIGCEDSVKVLIDNINAGSELMVGRSRFLQPSLEVLSLPKLQSMGILRRLCQWYCWIPTYTIGECVIVRYDLCYSLMSKKWNPGRQLVAWWRRFHNGIQ